MPAFWAPDASGESFPVAHRYPDILMYFDVVKFYMCHLLIRAAYSAFIRGGGTAPREPLCLTVLVGHPTTSQDNRESRRNNLPGLRDPRSGEWSHQDTLHSRPGLPKMH